MRSLRMGKQEKGWVFLFTLVLLVLSSLPYLIAVQNQEEGQFTGFLIAVEDGNSYIAKMLRGAQGDWLFKSPYSVEEQGGALLYLPYLLLGKIFGPEAQHDQLVWLFHAFRGIALFLLCWASYDFLSLYIRKIALRRLGLALATLGGGMGWLLLALGLPNWLGSLPLDFYSPESFGFLSVFAFPHLSLGRALMFWGLRAYLINSEKAVRADQIKFGLLWLGMALVHLLSAVIGLLIMLLHLIIMRVALQWSRKRKNDNAQSARHFGNFVWAGAGAAIPVLVNLYMLASDAYLQAWAAQNQILSPHFLHYLLGYGLLLPFAYFGARLSIYQDWRKGGLLIGWIAMLPLLLYSPLGLQRRFADGVWVAIIILAMLAFESDRFKNKKAWRWLLLGAFPSTILLLLGSVQIALNASEPAFRPNEEVSVFEILRANANSNDLVLSSFEIGNALPAWVPVRVVIGHGPESVGLAALAPMVEEFYRSPGSPASHSFLQKLQVRFILLGPSEKDSGNLSSLKSLKLIAGAGEFELYEILED